MNAGREQVSIPDIALEQLDGEQISLVQVAENNITVVNLWASWCPPCIKQINEGKAFKDRLEVENNVEWIYISPEKNYEKWLRAKKSLKWLVARLPASSEFTIITFNDKVVSHTNKRWMSGSDVSSIQATLGSALNEIPKGGTNLEVAFEEVKQMKPVPDSVYLITDGLPTKGMPPKGITLDILFVFIFYFLNNILGRKNE